MRATNARARVQSLVARSARRSKAAVEHALNSLSSKLSIGAVLACCALPLLPQMGAHVAGSAAAPTRPSASAPAATPLLAQPATRIEVVKARPLSAPEASGLEAEPGTQPEPQEKTALRARRSATPPALPKEPPKELAKEPAKDPAKPEPAPPPAAWSETEIATALKACIQLLGPAAVEVEALPAMKQDQCGTPAPLLLRRLGTGAASVEVQPPAVLNCAMIAKLAAWVTHTLQPTAKDALGASVTRLNSASGYVCRGRNGDRLDSGKLSEHALANAIDIASFTLSDGRIIDVGKHWGPTRRDQPPPHPAPSAPDVRKPAPKRGAAQASPAQVPATTASAKAMPAEPAAQFLRRLHQGACSTFGTVLGPEANEAHREHFHFDLAARKHSAYCQ